MKTLIHIGRDIRTLASAAGLALLAITVACSGASPSEPVPPTVPVNASGLDFTAFDSTLNAAIAAQGLAGATAVIVQKDSGIVHLAGYGTFDKNRAFLLASASKILSVGVLMRLADQHAIDIDAPIGTYVGSAWGTEKESLTIAQMLSNSSGMVGLVDDPLYRPYICQYRHVGTLLGCAQQIYQAADSSQIVPPDTQFRYGGGQWQLAGGIAEAASGKSWAELIRETYIEPCGTTTLGYTNQFSAVTRGYPSSFNGDAANAVPTDNPSIEGGGYITAEDYGKILLMHLRGGTCGANRVLEDSSVVRMQQDRIGQVYGGVTNKPVLQGYGLGWWVDRAHAGVVADIGLYGATAWLDTNRGYGVMILIEGNSAVGGNLLVTTKPILDALFDAAHL